MVKMLVMDVDGTLTDGTICIGNQGELCKSFYARDGLGILKIKDNGIIPVVITSRESNIVRRRCRELGIENVVQGAKDKLEALKFVAGNNKVAMDEIAYIADDINDIEAMKAAGLKACPNDAVEEIRQLSDFISSYNGGRGAVREFCEYILKCNLNKNGGLL